VRPSSSRADMPLPSQGLYSSTASASLAQPHPDPHLLHSMPFEGGVYYGQIHSDGGWGAPMTTSGSASMLAAVQPAVEELEGTPLPTIVDAPPSDPDGVDGGASSSTLSFSKLSLQSPLGMDADSGGGDGVVRGRIIIYCTAEKLDREALKERLVGADSSPPGALHQLAGLRMTSGNSEGAGATVGDGQPLTWQGDVLHVSFPPSPDTSGPRDVFFFEYGMTVMWGLSQKEETAVLKNVVEKCGVGPFDPSDHGEITPWTRIHNLQPLISNR